MKKYTVLVIAIVFVILWASACSPKTEATPTEVIAEETKAPEVQPSAAPAEPTTAVETKVTSDPVITESNGLSPEPQEFEFQAMDGRMLEGIYYPAASNPAPLVIFMHWVNGDMHDWNELSVWLQNRGQKNPYTNPGNVPWLDPTWFPVVPADRSYGVFIFTFRGCKGMTEGGCGEWDIQGWMQDIEGVMMYAPFLEGVDQERIAVIGSSIGADGAAYGCLFLSKQFPGSCKGALSLSPGSYLVHDYADVVEDLGKLQPSSAAWCLADEGEIGICKRAVTDDNPLYKYYEIPGGGHGNSLISPKLSPLPMDLILEFLAEVLQ